MTDTNKEIAFTEPHYVAGIADIQIEQGPNTWIVQGRSRCFIMGSNKNKLISQAKANVEHGSKTYVAGNYTAEDSEDDGYHD